VPRELERITAIKEPFKLLRAATDRLGEAQREVTELARLRRRVVQELHAQGMSYAQIADAAGLSRGRIHQIRHAGPAPEGAFLGAGSVAIVTPLKLEARNARPVVAMEDVAAAERLAALARSHGLEVTQEHVSLDGKIDLYRPGLIVICGPRLSTVMAELYAADPVLRWEQAADGPWTLRDTATGTLHRSGADERPPSARDAAYLGRLPCPDGDGTVLAFTGIHPPGTLGVVQLLTSDLRSLWEQAGTEAFSVVVGVRHDPATNEPTEVSMLSPLYRHRER
jgi:transposase